MWSVLRFFQDETSSTVLNALKDVDRGSRKTRKEIITVVTLLANHKQAEHTTCIALAGGYKPSINKQTCITLAVICSGGPIRGCGCTEGTLVANGGALCWLVHPHWASSARREPILRHGARAAQFCPHHGPRNRVHLCELGEERDALNPSQTGQTGGGDSLDRHEVVSDLANFSLDETSIYLRACVCACVRGARVRVCVCVPRKQFLGNCWSHHHQTWHANASRVIYIYLDHHSRSRIS